MPDPNQAASGVTPPPPPPGTSAVNPQEWQLGGTPTQKTAPPPAPPGTTAINPHEWSGSSQAPQRDWLDSVKDFIKGTWATAPVHPISMFQGAAQMAAHPIDTYLADNAVRTQIKNRAEQSFKQGDYGRGAVEMLKAFIPFIGPQTQHASDLMAQGKVAEGAGEATGLGLSLTAPEALKNVPVPAMVKNAAGKLSERVYQSTLKPPPASFTPEEVESMVKTGLQHEIPISEAGLAKVETLITDLNNKVSAEINAAPPTGAPRPVINRLQVASRLGDVGQTFGEQVLPEEDLATIQKAGEEFTAPGKSKNLTPQEAQAQKVGTYRQLKGKYGELSSARIESEKALARGLKEELEVIFPEIKGLNAEESQLLGLNEALERAANRIGNRDVVSLGGKIIAAGGAALGGTLGAGRAVSDAGAAVGAESSVGAISGALGALAIHHILTDPTIVSKMAIAMNKASQGSITIPAAVAKISGYANILGNSIEQQRTRSQNEQPPVEPFPVAP